MAITIISQPTNENCTKTNLIYNVSSSNVTQPQFQYVMDVYETSATGSADRLARIRQFPNPINEAVFDPARIFDDNLEYDVNNLTQTGGTLLIGTTQEKEFVCKFGEEYGTSPSSSVTLYPDLATGNFMQVWPCQVDPNNGVSFESWGGLFPFTGSGAAYMSDRPDDILDGVNTYRHTAFINRDASVLPSNLYVTESYSSGTTNYYEAPYAQVMILGTSQLVTDSDEVLTYTFDGVSYTRKFFEDCNYPIYNFMFINRYGVWENFSTNKPARVNTSVGRQNYDQSFVNYSNDGAYNVKRRGSTNFSTTVNDDITISSDWLSKEGANWLQQLIESDEVYLAVSPDNSSFKPIVITNSSYVRNTARKDQKIFAYDITFKYANQRRGR